MLLASAILPSPHSSVGEIGATNNYDGRLCLGTPGRLGAWGRLETAWLEAPGHQLLGAILQQSALFYALLFPLYNNLSAGVILSTEEE